MPTYTFANYRVQRGLSLIELMISITIGLLILVALTTLFVNQSQTRAELDKSTRMIENGRYAMELLSDNLGLAGFYGELDPSAIALPGLISDPCIGGSPGALAADLVTMAGMLRLHVGGYNAAGYNSVIGAPPCGLTALNKGSDILVLRRADTSNPVSVAAAVNGVHYLQASRCSVDVLKFTLSTTPANFTRSTFTPAIKCTTDSTAPYADLRRFIVQTYFVATDNNPGDGIPTLKRRELDPAGSGTFVTTALVEGVEYFQVEYGIDDPAKDTDGDGTIGEDGIADSYLSCSPCSIEQWSRVVTVKLYIITRNIEQTPGYNDGKTYTLGLAGEFGPFDDKFKRRVYTQVVRLTNPSSRKEVP